MGIFRGFSTRQMCRSTFSIDSGACGAVTTLELLHKMQNRAIMLLHFPGVLAAIGRLQIAVGADFAAKTSQKELVARFHQIQP